MTMTRAGRPLPMLQVEPPPLSSERAPAASEDERVEQFRPETRALPRFYVWTLGCQMNRSDSEEMAGRLLSAGCAESPAMDAADLVVINTCAIREAAEAKVIGRQGELAKLKAANPSMRVVMTGCAVREMDHERLGKRFPAVDLFLRPDQEPELVDRLGLASAQGPVGIVGIVGTMGTVGTVGATTVVGRTAVGVADHLPGTRAAAIHSGAVRRHNNISAWLPIIYGCDKTCTYCIVPFSRGPERSRPFDDIVDEARAIASQGFREVTLLGQNVNSYGHDLAPEARFGHVRTERWAGRQLDLGSRPDLAELIRSIDGLRTADGETANERLRFITSHPWDLSDRLIEAMADCPSVCEALHLPVQSGDDAMLKRMGRQYSIEHYIERLSRIREAIPEIAISTDVIVGFCGETEAQYESTLRLLETVRYDQVFAAAYSERPGTPATRLADDVPPDVKRRRLNGLLALQEPIGLERNRRWLGRTVEVLVDTVVPPRSHEHEDADEPSLIQLGLRSSAGANGSAAMGQGSGRVHLTGRTRQSKLVHLEGPREWLGTFVNVRVEHTGPYALRGSAAVPSAGDPE
jgi:tRNA-2-methylthio-N6-dimethylallyladenosine synthase